MGVTWILGIAANLRVLSFLWYPYVVLNSLQGTSPFFIISNFTSVCNLPRVKKLYTTVYAFFLITVEVEVRGACQCSCVFNCKCRDMASNNDQLLAWNVPAENHGICIHHVKLAFCCDVYHYQDSLQAGSWTELDITVSLPLLLMVTT